MDFWFQFAVTVLKGILAGLHFDPTKATTFRRVLLDVANSIYMLYGITPPAQ